MGADTVLADLVFLMLVVCQILGTLCVNRNIVLLGVHVNVNRTLDCACQVTLLGNGDIVISCCTLNATTRFMLWGIR